MRRSGSVVLGVVLLLAGLAAAVWADDALFLGGGPFAALFVAGACLLLGVVLVAAPVDAGEVCGASGPNDGGVGLQVREVQQGIGG